ncbi:hypothetical protein BDB01DRAFT_785794 [Pilobolus umbonatus]|nr:hypothetical protein BDB01DRAFT_785794 [Pilobolus umbonatus]
MVATTKNASIANIGGNIDTINKRVSGKNWKVQKNATVRNQQSKKLRKNWEQRTLERNRLDSAKKLERELKASKQAEKDRKREITLERKKIKEEKERMEALAAKMSAKRLERLKRREARKKARI